MQRSSGAAWRGLVGAAHSCTLGADHQTVRGWRPSGEFPAWHRRPRGSSVDRHAAKLGRRRDEGCHNAAQLWREIQHQGCPGRLRTVQRWVNGRRSADPAASGVSRAAPWPTPSKHRTAWLVVAGPERLDVAQSRPSLPLTSLQLVSARFSTNLRTLQMQPPTLPLSQATEKGMSLTRWCDHRVLVVPLAAALDPNTGRVIRGGQRCPPMAFSD